MNLDSIINILLVIFAFGFVIFWHELGHFLAARWAGVRVEQFAVGMGHAIFSYRPGMGIRLGNTAAEFEKRVSEEHAKRSTGTSFSELSLREKYDIAKQIGLGETEYRLAWIPLGGYVKPTGQDDLRPAAQVQAGDPRAYGAAPVGKRMVIICAGVVMNVILAFALYVALFIYGFNAPPAVVGQVTPGSPAQAAGLAVGDRIISIDGYPQQDYTKLTMNVALLSAEENATFVVDRPGEGQKTLTVRPQKTVLNQNMPAIGVMPASTLRGPDKLASELPFISPMLDLLAGGGRVVRVGDVDVSNDETDAVLDRAIQQSAGRAVMVTVQSADKSQHVLKVTPTLLSPNFNREPSTILGLSPRTSIEAVLRGAPADKAGLRSDDVVTQILAVGSGEPLTNPPVELVKETTAGASKANRKLQMTIERDGVLQPSIEVDTSFALDSGGRGIGVSMRPDLGAPVVASVARDSSALRAGIRSGDRIVNVAGTDTGTWATLYSLCEMCLIAPRYRSRFRAPVPSHCNSRSRCRQRNRSRLTSFALCMIYLWCRCRKCDPHPIPSWLRGGAWKRRSIRFFRSTPHFAGCLKEAFLYPTSVARSAFSAPVPAPQRAAWIGSSGLRLSSARTLRW